MSEQAFVNLKVPTRWKSRLRKWTVQVVCILISVYVGLGVILYFAQTWMIFPGHASQGTRGAYVRATKDSELVTLQTRGGIKIVALFGGALSPDGSPRADASARPTVMFFYGNAMSLADCFSEFRHLREAGANVIIPEFVGYGASSGKPSEQGCYDTADAAYNYLLTRSDVDASRVVAAGWSVGAASAVDLAVRRPVAGLMTFSAFTSTAGMAHNLFPVFPTSLLVRHRFENEQKFGRLTCPILLCHGRHDTIVPYWMSDELARAAKSPLTRVTFDSNHNDLFDVGGDVLWARVKQFLDSLAPPAPVVRPATTPS